MRIHTAVLLVLVSPFTLALACTGLDDTALITPDTKAETGGIPTQSLSGAGGALTVPGTGGYIPPNPTPVGGSGGGVIRSGGLLPTGGSIPYGGTLSIGGYWNTGGFSNTGGAPKKPYVAGMVTKAGGTRDLVSMQCLGEGPNCTHTIDYATCMLSNCPEQTGTAIPVLGLSKRSLCNEFYTCMAYCTCGEGRSICEDGCLADSKKIPDCYAALVAMDACAKETGCDKLGCPMIK